MRVHSGEKPFNCAQCEYSCTQAGQLKTHILTHSGERPFICKQCNYSSTNKAHLNRHMLIHSGKKSHTCKQCCQKARFQVTKNGTSGAETKKRRPLFNANIPPKWCRARLFYAFSTFGWILSQFKKFGKRSERIFCGPWKSANSCHPECRYTLKRDSLTFHLPICSRQLSYSAWLCCLQYRKTTQMPLVQGS